MIRQPPKSTPFPCTPLFRSDAVDVAGHAARRAGVGEVDLDHVVALAAGQPDAPDARAGAERLHQRALGGARSGTGGDRKSTRLNSSHANISYAVFCLKKKNT